MQWKTRLRSQNLVVSPIRRGWSEWFEARGNFRGQGSPPSAYAGDIVNFFLFKVDGGCGEGTDTTSDFQRLERRRTNAHKRVYSLDTCGIVEIRCAKLDWRSQKGIQVLWAPSSRVNSPRIRGQAGTLPGEVETASNSRSKGYRGSRRMKG